MECIGTIAGCKHAPPLIAHGLVASYVPSYVPSSVRNILRITIVLQPKFHCARARSARAASAKREKRVRKRARSASSVVEARSSIISIMVRQQIKTTSFRIKSTSFKIGRLVNVLHRVLDFSYLLTSLVVMSSVPTSLGSSSLGVTVFSCSSSLYRTVEPRFDSSLQSPDRCPCASCGSPFQE